METRRYIRKPFYVDVVEVTHTNRDEIAAWVGGEVQDDKDGYFVKVPVTKPQSERQTKAYPGDFVLQAKNGFKVFTRGAFEMSFMPAPEEKHSPRTDRGKRQKPNQPRNDALLAKAARGHLSDEDVAAGL